MFLRIKRAIFNRLKPLIIEAIIIIVSLAVLRIIQKELETRNLEPGTLTPKPLKAMKSNVFLYLAAMLFLAGTLVVIFNGNVNAWHILYGIAIIKTVIGLAIDRRDVSPE